MRCEKTEDWAQVAQYLRGNLLANQCLVESLESNMPPVPREVWVVKGGGGVGLPSCSARGIFDDPRLRGRGLVRGTELSLGGRTVPESAQANPSTA